MFAYVIFDDLTALIVLIWARVIIVKLSIIILVFLLIILQFSLLHNLLDHHVADCRRNHLFLFLHCILEVLVSYGNLLNYRLNIVKCRHISAVRDHLAVFLWWT